MPSEVRSGASAMLVGIDIAFLGVVVGLVHSARKFLFSKKKRQLDIVVIPQRKP